MDLPGLFKTVIHGMTCPLKVIYWKIRFSIGTLTDRFKICSNAKTGIGIGMTIFTIS